MTNALIRKLLGKTAIIMLLLAGFAVPPTIQANEDDWVLVDRFQRQLKAAEAGKIKAMYNVGKLYEKGRGTSKNLLKAAEWYQRAADAGQNSAKARLGIMYFEGRGVKQNYPKALALLSEAAKKNVPSAQYQLANMYELGTGVTQDMKKAIYWYQQAEKYGYYLAKGKIKRLQNLLKNTTSSNEPIQPPVTASTSKPANLLKQLTAGLWFKQNKPVSYLPSSTTNCVNDSFTTLHCISASQERSTGQELITFNTESHIRVKTANRFEITYASNVLDVKPLKVVDEDGNVIEATTSRIKKGRKGKQHTLLCTFAGSSITCSKNGSNFTLIRR